LVSAQDTSFSTGPQYLMNGSPLFATPISTPIMSLPAPAAATGASDATAGLATGATNQTIPASEAVSPPVGDLFPVYYGEPAVSVVDRGVSNVDNSRPAAASRPAQFFDAGVAQITSPQTLRERGYGETVAQAAAYQKAHTRRGVRVYTNEDIDRLRAVGQ
jgi:hypothetical protein